MTFSNKPESYLEQMFLEKDRVTSEKFNGEQEARLFF